MIALGTSSRNARVAAAPKSLGSPARRPGPGPGSAGRGDGRFAPRRQRVAGARLQGQGSRPSGDPHRPRDNPAGRPNSAATSGRPPRLGRWKTRVEEPKPSTPRWRRSVLVEPTVRRVNAKFGTGSYLEIFLRIPAPPRYYLHLEMKLVAGTIRHLRARRELVARLLAKVLAKLGHIGDHDLER